MLGTASCGHGLLINKDLGLAACGRPRFFHTFRGHESPVNLATMADLHDDHRTIRVVYQVQNPAVALPQAVLLGA